MRKNNSNPQIDFGADSIWQPASGDPTQGPLVVVLHGRGDSAQGFTWLQGALGIPGFSALLLTAPDPYYGGFSWYDLPPDQLPGIRRSREFLASVFGRIFDLGFAPERTFLFGFSQGCLMTLEFGARFPVQLAGYIGVSGYCYDPKVLLKEAVPTVLHGKNWLITHGTQDEALPISRTREQIPELIQGGFIIDYREYPKTHTIDPEREIGEIHDWLRTRI